MKKQDEAEKDENRDLAAARAERGRHRGMIAPVMLLALLPAAVLAIACSSAGTTADRPTETVAESPGTEAVPAEAPPAPSDDEAQPVPSDDEAQPVHKNTIKWSTASEVDNFGFDVHRSESADGPFERINPEIIEGAGMSDEPSYYRYVDTAIDPYKTYYYFVESISMGGVRERFTPIAKAKAKL